MKIRPCTFTELLKKSSFLVLTMTIAFGPMSVPSAWASQTSSDASCDSDEPDQPSVNSSCKQKHLASLDNKDCAEDALPTNKKSRDHDNEQNSQEFCILPLEMQDYIFFLLDTKSFHRAFLVCRSWRDIACGVGEERILDLSGRKLDQKDCEILGRPPPSLNLYSNMIGDEGVKFLATGNLSSLTSLCLSSNSIGYKGATAIIGGNFSAFTCLDMYYNSIKEEEKAALKKMSLLKRVGL